VSETLNPVPCLCRKFPDHEILPETRNPKPGPLHPNAVSSYTSILDDMRLWVGVL
jgi:hypothetical protein